MASNSEEKATEIVHPKKRGYYVRYGFNNDFVNLISKLKNKYGEKIFEIHGISDKDLDITQFPKKFYSKSAKAVASVSIDANANVSSKDISQYTYERFKPQQKMNSIYLLYKWVKKLFSKKDAEIAIERIISGDIFVNDLVDIEKSYCFAIDLNNLLADGMDFFDGKNIHIGIPKRSDSFIQQVIQSTAFISNQIMGAIAYPSFFPILDKFYRAEFGEDYISRYETDEFMKYKITNQFQNLIYSFNFPFRGNQCVDLDTEVLTPQGFKRYDELKVGDDIYTWNEGKLNIQKVQKVNISNFVGEMHSYSGRDMSHLVTPNHRVLYQFNNYIANKHAKWDIKQSSELINRKTPLTIPVAFEDNLTPDYPISDDDLTLLTCILTDGCVEVKRGNSDGYERQPRVRITKSDHRSHNLDIEALLNRLNLKYTITNKVSCFEGTGNEKYGIYNIQVYTISTESSKKYIDLLSATKTELPEFFMHLSKRQANLVLDTWSKMDGYQIKKSGHSKLQCDNEVIQDQLQQLALLACVGSKKIARWIGKNKKPTLYVITYSRKVKNLAKKEKVQYNGKVWCPTTEDGVVVFRKNGSVFISGNSSFTNLSVLDKDFMSTLFDGFVFADDGTSPNIDSSVELSKKFFEYFVDINNKEAVYTFPVMTLAVSLDNKNNYNDESIIDWISEVNHEKSIGNIFQSKPNSFCSCCRLKNDLDTVNEINGFGKINSFGASSGLSVGSHRVCGINLPRLAMKEKENPNQLDEVMDSIHKILYAHRMLIKERIELGVLPLYTHGWMHLNRQYSTVGLLGGYEYVKNKGLSILTEEGTNALMNVMKTIESKILGYQKEEKGCIYNIESIPGESQAVKLCDIDKVLGYCDSKTKLYSNQYVSLMDECSIYDRMKTQGIFDSVTSGGAIMHCTYKDSVPMTKEQYKAVVKMAKDLHNEYFAINYTYVKCANGHRSIGEKDTCDVCGAPITTRFQRVVGFITCVEAWNPTRRDYEYKRRTSVKADEACK